MNRNPTLLSSSLTGWRQHYYIAKVCPPTPNSEIANSLKIIAKLEAGQEIRFRITETGGSGHSKASYRKPNLLPVLDVKRETACMQALKVRGR
jgi:hypothetical protein